MANIQTRIESPRGCGYRKQGGMYLVSDGIAKACCMLPQELSVCPCCGEGIKPSRGWTWVSSQLLTNNRTCSDNACALLLAAMMHERMGLMWVGEKFYSTAFQFTDEANRMGVSKRIAQVPRELVVGQTWVLLAHRKAIGPLFPNSPLQAEYLPGIFRAFVPQRIEYVVTGKETEDELDALEKRGLTLIEVIRDVDLQGKIEQL